MINTSNVKNKMPEQEPDVRNKNFKEVALGYSEEQAVSEAQRCLNCKNTPCVSGCPVRIRIPEFIKSVAERDFEKAYQIIKGDSDLPAVCGRVCPQETQCEGKCVRGIKGESVGIGRLERFVADYHAKNGSREVSTVEKNGKKVAIIGSGPASLTCAGRLAVLGYDVTVYEALHVEGGVLMSGIPEFRLPKAIVRQEIENLKKSGVNFVTDCVIGKTISVTELKDEYGYDAIFIGTGAGLPRFMNIAGEDLNGVYSANEFLTRINLMGAYKEDSFTPVYRAKKTIVVGGGNVAMDSARCAKRLGADVTIVYRRTEKELPARREEVLHAKEEGINFALLTNPVAINGENGWVKSVTCIKMELGEPDASGRAKPVVIKDSEFDIEADCVIMALGTSPNPLIKNTTENLKYTDRGVIEVDENGATSVEGIYAGGDAVTGAATVILAMGAGKLGAKSIDEYLKNK
ncbi:MAG TPA: glutamate synthase (NADPH), homotetrameric [Clostridiales bacterium]|nr:glutamate synthase (NADPH), homotetrameric [Clostridiales bacterium]